MQESAHVCNIVGGVVSPLLANIALNFLDWQLDELGLRCVRYADDFVVLTKTNRQAEEARLAVEEAIGRLGLTLSPEKTHVTRFAKGFSFLGFRITNDDHESQIRGEVQECSPGDHHAEPQSR